MNFYVASIVSLLGMRFMLDILGYPIVGNDAIHFSHALTGGILMFIALLLQNLFIDRRVMQVSSFLGGFGFGLFIDEVGKLITRDYNYFFQPAVVMIYVIYLAIFFLLYKIRYASPMTKEENDANTSIELAEVQPTLVWKLQSYWRGKYRILSKTEKFQQFVQVALYAYVGFVFINTVRMALFSHSLSIGFTSIGQLVSNIVAALCVVIGATYLRTSKRKAYKYYERAIGIWILITQVFVFYEDQFSAVIYLIGSLLLLAAVRYMKDEEHILTIEQERGLSLK